MRVVSWACHPQCRPESLWTTGRTLCIGAGQPVGISVRGVLRPQKPTTLSTSHSVQHAQGPKNFHRVIHHTRACSTGRPRTLTSAAYHHANARSCGRKSIFAAQLSVRRSGSRTTQRSGPGEAAEPARGAPRHPSKIWIGSAPFRRTGSALRRSGSDILGGPDQGAVCPKSTTPLMVRVGRGGNDWFGSVANERSS